MIRKKISIFVLICFCFFISTENARAVSGATILKISGASAILASGALMFPALVGTTSDLSAWLPIVGSIAALTTISTPMLIAGVAAAAVNSALWSFSSAAHGPIIIKDGQVGYNQSNVIPPAGFNVDNYYIWANGVTGTYHLLGYYSSNALAIAAINAAATIYQSGGGSGIYYGYSRTYLTVPNNHYDMEYYFAFVGTGNYSSSFVAHTASSLSSDLSTALTAGDPKAVNVVRAALTEFDNNLQGTSSKLSGSTFLTAKTAIDDLVTQTQKDQVDAGTPTTAADIATRAGTMADANQGLTAAQIQAALEAALAGNPSATAAEIQAAISAAMAANPKLSAAEVSAAMAAALAANPKLTIAEVTSAMSAALALHPTITAAEVQAAMSAALAAHPSATAAEIQAAITAALAAAVVALPAANTQALPSAYAVPATEAFSARISSFFTTMRATSFFSLPGYLTSSIPSGGSCTMSIEMGSRFGGTREFSICNWSTGLTATKAAFLCICSILAVGIVVKGGGG